MTSETVVIRLLFSLIAGGILGYERSLKRIDAGFRTHILVCMSSCAIMLTNLHMFLTLGAGDPSRMPAQVISGVGFLGAGCILVTGQKRIKGVTTAAGLWSAACLGLCIGAGNYVISGVTLSGAFFALTLFRIVDDRIEKKTKYLHFYAEFESVSALTAFIRTMRKQGHKVTDLETVKSEVMAGLAAIISIHLKNPDSTHKKLAEFEKLDGVLFLSEL